MTDRLTVREAEAVLIHIARSLEMSAHPEPNATDQAAIDKLKAIIGDDRFDALNLGL